MDRQSRPLTGEAQPQGRPMGAAFRAREFRRSASLTWEGEGFETDNLARQSAGMRRAATLPLGSTNVRRNDEDEIEEACRLLSPHPEEPRAARRLEGWRRSPLQPTLRDAGRWRAPQGEVQGQRYVLAKRTRELVLAKRTRDLRQVAWAVRFQLRCLSMDRRT